MCIAVRPPSAMLSSSISSEVAWAARMPWRAAALMAITFCMTVSHYCRLAALVGEIVNQHRFQDVCAKSGKWFRARKNCFVVLPMTKHSRQKHLQFELDGSTRVDYWGLGIRPCRRQARTGI